jgi:RNA-directed DNA polymerase
LRKGRDTWVLEADIQGFFDNIAHESILKQLGNFPGRNLIKGWLKAGFIFEGKYNPTETGTPQGGVWCAAKRTAVMLKESNKTTKR